MTCKKFQTVILLVLSLIFPSFVYAEHWGDLILDTNPEYTTGNQYFEISGWDGNGAFTPFGSNPNQSFSIEVEDIGRAGADDAKITTNVNNIASMTNSLTSNTSAINSNSSKINQNAQAIVQCEKGISTNSQSISNNTGQIALNAQTLLNLDKKIDKVEDDLIKGMSLFSAMDFQRPVDGKTFRLSIGTGSYQGESALGLSLTAVINSIDFSVGVATAGSKEAGKASIGFSF